MEYRRARVLLFVVAVPSVFAGTCACGATTGIEFGEVGDAGGAAESSSDAGDGPASSWSPFCPESAPALGSRCPSDLPATMLGDLECEYGCGDVLVCAEGTWSGAPGHWFCQAGPNPTVCPSAIASIAPGGACTEVGATCAYATGICQCNAPSDPTPDGGVSWWCGPGSGCPMPRPRIGSGCSTVALTCAYEECGTAQECQGGVWRTAPGACGG